jgi:hypothetical protein
LRFWQACGWRSRAFWDVTLCRWSSFSFLVILHSNCQICWQNTVLVKIGQHACTCSSTHLEHNSPNVNKREKCFKQKLWRRLKGTFRTKYKIERHVSYQIQNWKAHFIPNTKLKGTFHTQYKIERHFSYPMQNWKASFIPNTNLKGTFHTQYKISVSLSFLLGV